MISRIIKEDLILDLRKYLNQYNNIVITCHVSPDGDATGSALGLSHLLTTIGKNVKIVTPDAIPENLSFLPGAEDIVAANRYPDFARQLFSNAELIFCMDFNEPKRMDRLSELLLESPAKRVLIDHHLNPDDFCDITISYPSVCSTCELLFRVICRLGLINEINRQAAECIYTGMMTDTGNFSYNSNRADIYIIIAELIKKGIDKDKIFNIAMNTSTENRLRLAGFSIYEKMKIFPEQKAALITLSKEELQRFDYKKGDTESIVNRPLAIPEVQWVIFMREDDDYVKISARSQGDFAVNTICEKYFNGGGHKNASGGEFFGSLSDAVKKYLEILESMNNEQN